MESIPGKRMRYCGDPTCSCHVSTPTTGIDPIFGHIIDPANIQPALDDLVASTATGWKENFQKFKTAYERGREELLDELEKEVKGLIKRNKTAKCCHRTPREVTANDYNCSDMHLGAAETLSDVLSIITSKRTK